jgi:CheY-like chemotaxis protein
MIDNEAMSKSERETKTASGDNHPPAAKILLIDDDENITQVLGKYLRKHGYDVTSVNSGREGIRVASALLPDLVVCDLDMPGMDGYEVLASLRQDPRLTEIPVVFLTGRAAPDQIRQGMNLGADDYLTKPVDLNNLLRAIEARLVRARLGRLNQEKQMERAMQLFDAYAGNGIAGSMPGSGICRVERFVIVCALSGIAFCHLAAFISPGIFLLDS